MATSLCIVGWYLNLETYKQIKKLTGVDSFYVIMHKKDLSFKLEVEKLGFKVFEKENKGWDWGAYQQWLDYEFWKSQNFCFFMHDDIQIKDFDIIKQSKQTLRKTGANVIGNSRNAGGKQDWTKTHPQCYSHSSWKPPKDFSHLTVRGSFFGVPRRVLEAIKGEFEINWASGNVRIGNHSLIATCGKIAHLAGNTFQYLGEGLNTKYLIEFSKGKRQEKKRLQPKQRTRPRRARPKPQPRPNKESPQTVFEATKNAATPNPNRKNDNQITVVSSNFNTARFMQLLEKSLIKTAKDPFQFIVASRVSEKIQLENAKIINTNINATSGSAHHGSVLNKIVSLVESEYTLIIDADCFICKKYWDVELKGLMAKYRLIGARAFRTDKEFNTKMLHANFIFGKTEDLQNNIDYRPSFKDNIDTAGKLSVKLRRDPILHIEFREPTQIFKGIKCAEYFFNKDPFWYHFGRGGNRKKSHFKQKWYNFAGQFLNNY